MLHIMNGDSIRPIFESSLLPGTMTVWADPLHDGPVPSGLSDDQMRDVRARFLAGGSEPYDRVLNGLRQWDAAIEGFSRHAEVVLWFEHDLFDQLALIRHLNWFSRRPLGSTTLSLICIGAFPGVEPFRGLGQLSSSQFASLFDSRSVVTPAQIALGRRAWSAFTSPDPTDVEALLEEDTSALVFLAPALRRYLQEFPASRSGLPRTEKEILTVLAETPASPLRLFDAARRDETSFFMGDTQFRTRLDRLAAPPRPLITMRLEPGRNPTLPEGTIAITEAGRTVLSGDDDWLAMAVFDRWFGGVHVSPGSIWRWDEERERLHRD